MKTVFCKNCGKEIDEQAAFCNYCGTATDMVPQVKKTVICKHCGNEIDSEATFCNHCGLATDMFQKVEFPQKPQKEEDVITGGFIALWILLCLLFSSIAGLTYGLLVKKNKPNTGRACIIISIIAMCIRLIAMIIYNVMQ